MLSETRAQDGMFWIGLSTRVNFKYSQKPTETDRQTEDIDNSVGL